MNKSSSFKKKSKLFIRYKKKKNQFSSNLKPPIDNVLLLQELITSPQVETEIERLTSQTTTFSITITTSSCTLILEKLLSKHARHSIKMESIGQSNNKTNTFISQVKKTMEQNLHDETFGIQQLCKAIGISRSQLHNKIKTKTGLSTSIYIRSIKLEKAKKLLEQTELNVSEVAYAVGFKDPSYFSRLFTEKYKISPSNYKKVK